MRHLIGFILAVTATALLFTNCHRSNNVNLQLDLAEELMSEDPAGSLRVLTDIASSPTKPKEEARYALLMSMALDKNYIDTTTFDVLQPAIDYYLQSGSPDEKLRTFYYQGRIYQNQGNIDMAMCAFLKGEEQQNYTDTITFANLLVAQGKLYAQSYQTKAYIENNLTAAHLYGTQLKYSKRLSSLIRALDGCIVIRNRELADSLLDICEEMVQSLPEAFEEIHLARLTYTMRFGSDNDIRQSIDALEHADYLTDVTRLDLTLGLLTIGEPARALKIFETIDSNSQSAHYLRYLSIKADLMEVNQRYPEALCAYRKYYLENESIKNNIYLQKTSVAKELYELETKNLKDLRFKDRIIAASLCLLFISIIVGAFIYYRHCLTKAKKRLTEEEQRRSQLENENMHIRIMALEKECESLKEIKNQAELPSPIRETIKERIATLNSLFTAEITDRTNCSKPYGEWLHKITEDQHAFVNSTRLVFGATHPKFIKYLENHGLTIDEINYACMYAIGLRGKDIGEYTQMKRHYHTSSEIRKKLGLKEDDTNLGLHIRDLLNTLQ